MDKGLLKTIVACVTALAVALILAASVKYYADGTRYAIVTGTPPVAYLVDKRYGRVVSYFPSNKSTHNFSMPPTDVFDEAAKDMDKVKPGIFDDLIPKK